MSTCHSYFVHWDVADVERSKERAVRTLTLRVLGRREESDGVVSLALGHPDGGELPRWKPGAHLDLHVVNRGVTAGGDDVGQPHAGVGELEPFVRQYSLSSDPGDRRTYRVGILKEVSGRGGSRAVHEHLHEGATLTVSWPRNNFRLVSSPKYLFIAGGIGITPILSMIREAERSGAQWRLVYGGRSRDSMAFLHELDAYGDRVQVVPQDELGRIDLPGLLSEPQQDTLVYCCGPEPLLQAAEAQMTRWPKGSLRMERFAPRVLERTLPDEAFEVEFAASGSTVRVGAQESILEAAGKAGLPVISSCKTGTCGTCETRILTGRADHRDSILTPDEHEANETMMICVSRAEGGCPRLVLDR